LELHRVRQGIWVAGNMAWVFGLCDRTSSALTDQYLSATDLIQLGTASLLFVAWLFLYPVRN
jgi:hypothetical protein